MPVTKELLNETLSQAFPDSEIKITDLAGDNDHWSVEIKDAVFAGKSRIEQHKMVVKSTAHLNIHALQIKTLS